MNNLAVKELYSEKHTKLPNVNSLLKISLGLILFTMISTALVYAETMSVDVDGTTYDVNFSTEQVDVKSMITEYEPDSNYAGLIINVVVTGDPGTLELILDRSFMDSTFDGIDDDYFVLVDGLEPNFTETTTTQSRILNIDVPSGTEDIEIIGTVFGQSVEEPPVEETPEEEPPVEETPEEEPPVEETPTEDTPVVETPVVETPVEEKPKTQCGPGTVLKNGACVLDERCGPGTVLKDGACVLDPKSQPSSSSGKGMGKEAIMGFVVAFLGAGIVAVVFGIIARSQK